MSARTVATIKTPGLHADGGGLYLQVTRGRDGAPKRSWLLRYTGIDGRRREMGLGSALLVDLSDAREAALAARKQAKTGLDPIEARADARAQAAASRAKATTFRQCAEIYLATHASSWKNAKHRSQWQSTLEVYAYPVLGDLPVGDIEVVHVMRALDPIWLTKTETASRLRGRIESVLDWAAVRGFRKGENPARWRGHLEKALPTIKKSLRVRHHPALPFAEMAPFMKKLARQPGVSARALELCIVTATRTGETINARWTEFDLENRVWIIPAERMKIPREHRVPLSPAAVALLVSMGPADIDSVVFPGPRPGQPLSNMALLMIVKRVGGEDLTTHGFRSSFSDWAAERTDFPREVVEAALAHAVGNQVEAAYRRGDLFDKRRLLMDAWGAYCVPAVAISRAS